jgi:peptidoglycan/xylan/chitin deacetylase (PgdA/CDA1 family)
MGTMKQRSCLWMSIVGGLAVWWAVWAQPVGAASVGMVVGGAGVNVRSCPSISCNVIDVLPLGSSVQIEGDAVDGFVPVRHNSLSGYAYQLFVASNPQQPPYLLEGTPGCNRVALIFDIGIGDDPAWGIIDTLQQEGVPATMFVMGWWAKAHPADVQRLANDGFVIGSHGDQPVELTSLSDAGVVQDIQNAAAAIEDATGSPPEPWFTAYAAAADDRVRSLVARQGYLPVSRTVPAIDYGSDATAAGVYQRVSSQIYDGAIVEMHLDGPASATSTGVALPKLIHTLRAQGYQFVTIPEMASPCS